MRPIFRALLLLVAIIVVLTGGVVAYVARTGLSAREEPGRIETMLARNLRELAIANRARNLSNPIERAPEVIAGGRAHFAEHCAVCHGNDGRGDTIYGRGMWPKPPDLRQSDTQNLSDGEIFYIIEHGIRFSGMPGFGSGTKEGETESWHLVHFVRHLPDISEPELAEMEKLNPKLPDERPHGAPVVSHTH